MPRIVEEAFHLNQDDPAITELDGTAAVWSDIWDYQVPSGMGHVIRPDHTLSFYLEDASAEVGSGTCRIRIEVRDASSQDRRAIFGPAQYITVKDFTDVRKIARFNVTAPVDVLERQHIVVVVNDDGAIDASDSYFDMRIARTRRTLT